MMCYENSEEEKNDNGDNENKQELKNSEDEEKNRSWNSQEHLRTRMNPTDAVIHK